MRHLLFTILTNIAICTTTTSGLLAQSNYSPLPVAHRGCWFTNQIPENSIAAIRTAKRYGYKAIECDVKYTKDSILVINNADQYLRSYLGRITTRLCINSGGA